MSLFILTETSAGYALLKAKDKKLFKHGLPEDASTAEGVSNLYVQPVRHLREATMHCRLPAELVAKVLLPMNVSADPCADSS